jgi:hypothetical protein
MLDYKDIFSIDPYSYNHKEKANYFLEIMRDLTTFHNERCPEYHKILRAIGVDTDNFQSVADIPFIPVRLFKQFDLKSVASDRIVKTMTSSGTTGQQVSKVYLDRETSISQSKALTKIVSSNIGNSRLPMIILDTSAVIKNRQMFSARGAGILGFSIFGRDIMYALDEDMNLDIEAIEIFLKKHSGKKIFLFGFTFMIWQYFYSLLKTQGYHPDLSQGIMIHGGGWKKLIDNAVTHDDFKKALNSVCDINDIYDYYGMVEQTGSIYMECECGYLHASVYSDVIIRKHEDFSPAEYGEKGIIQTLSVLCKSYPGHSILTEDEGILLGEDDCLCGRKGKYFKVLGRIKNAEIRGCSDAFASNFA